MCDRELDDDRHQERVKIFQDLFADRESTASAAKKLASIALLPEETLTCLWAHIVILAQTMPEQQNKLVSLLVHISDLPPARDDEGIEFKVYDMQVWKDLPMFGWEMRDPWNGPQDIPSEAGLARRKATSAYVNINKFAARMTLTSVPALEFRLYGLWAMRSALEEPITLESWNAC